MKRKRLKQFLCALLTVSMVAGQPLSLLAAEEAVTEVGAEGFSDAQEAVEDVDEEQVLDAQEIPPQMSDDTDSAFSDASDTAQTDSLFGDGSTEAEEFSDSGEDQKNRKRFCLSENIWKVRVWMWTAFQKKRTSICMRSIRPM